MPHFMSWPQLNAFIKDAFKGYGVPEEGAEVCTDVLLESDRRGIESHGVTVLSQSTSTVFRRVFSSL